MGRMSEEELEAIVMSQVSDTSTYVSSQLSKDRLDSFRYYLGMPFGNEVGGASQVVMPDVYDVVEGVMPSLVRVFLSSDKVAIFEPAQAEDVEFAKQATDYVNYLMMRKNDGFMNFYTAFKDALMYKNCIAKVWYEDSEEEEKERFTEIDDMQFLMLAQDANVELRKHEEYEGEDGQIYHDVTVVRKKSKSGVKWCIVPPEEFMISRRAASIESAEFVGQRTQMRRSDLVARGYSRKEVDMLPQGDDWSYSLEKVERYAIEDSSGLPQEGATKQTELITVIEALVKVDYDDDGIAETRRVVIAGGKIFENEECDNIKFIGGAFIPLQHKFYGVAPVDPIKVVQLVRSTLWRQILDNVYRINNPRYIGVEGKFNMDDYLTHRAYGLIRTRDPNAIRPLETQPLQSGVFNLMEMLLQEREQRSGVTRYNQGLQADSLNKTATGINKIIGASEQRTELMARVIGETFVRNVARAIFDLSVRFEKRAQVVRMRNKFITVNPSMWNPDMDVIINVGVGTNNQDQMMTAVQTLIGLQEKIVQQQGGVQGPFVTMNNVYNAVAKMAETMGMKDVGTYFTDPDSPEMQQMMMAQAQEPEKPDPLLMDVQLRHEREREKMALDAAIEQRKLDLKEQELQLEARKIQIEQLKAESKVVKDGIEIARGA